MKKFIRKTAILINGVRNLISFAIDFIKSDKDERKEMRFYFKQGVNMFKDYKQKHNLEWFGILGQEFTTYQGKDIVVLYQYDNNGNKCEMERYDLIYYGES